MQFQLDAQVTEFLFNLITALHVVGVTTTHPQEHKATVSTASGKHYIVITLYLLQCNSYQML
jgi:hypothetical protein